MSGESKNEGQLNTEAQAWGHETAEELRARALEAIETGFRDKITGRLDRDAIHDRKLAREILKIEQEQELEAQRASES